MPDSRMPGARVIFSGGRAHLTRRVEPPPGWAPARVSVISPGTELRHLAATVTGPDHPAGYMTLTRPAGTGGYLLAPVPHGAAAPPGCAGALRVPAGTAVEHAAIARFQLMAALGLARCPLPLDHRSGALVIGTGPVAVGCVLELRRLGVGQIRVLTGHPAPAAARIPGVTVSPGLTPGAEPVVIDCTGRASAALRATAPGGMLGLLGTPARGRTLPASALHRSGVTVAGMHELAGHPPPARQAMFLTVLAGVTSGTGADLARAWCQVIPGQHAPSLYQALRSQRRPPQPFLLLDWSS